MDSLQIVKPPVEANVKSKAPSSQSIGAGDSQAPEKNSFSEKLAQVQPKSKPDAATDTEAKKANTTATKSAEANSELAPETKESKPKKALPLPNTPSFAQQGQELPPSIELTKEFLSVTGNMPVDQLPIPQQATAAAATIAVSALVRSQIKDGLTQPLTGPGSGSKNLPLDVKSINALTEDLNSLDKQGLKPVMAVAKEDTSVTMANLLKQMQQPLAQKSDLVAGVNPEKIVDKAIKLLGGADSFRSETVSAARAPDSGLNVGLTSDPFKIANENTDRVAQAPKINLPLSDSKWGEEFSNRIAWMSKNNIQSAQIKITPAHLGPIEVRVSLQNDQAAVSFVSNNAVVRDAIESASARLRETFAEGGFENIDVDVSSRENMNRQQADNEHLSAGNNTIDTKEDIADDVDLSAHAANDLDWDNAPKMGVDYFA